MSEFLLIHGACHGAWAWDRVIPLLQQAGHGARAIDLPGRDGVASLTEQAQAVLAALRGPTVLVGHSAGGYAITAAAQADPGLVTGLIYVCGYVPKPGMTLAQMRRAGPSQPLAGAFRLSADRSRFGFAPDLAPALFFHDCPDPAGATARLCREPVEPMETALPDTSRAESLPRGYVICRDDRAIPPQYQVVMAEGIAHQTSLPCGHSPFLALPERLAESLMQLAAAFG